MTPLRNPAVKSLWSLDIHLWKNDTKFLLMKAYASLGKLIYMTLLLLVPVLYYFVHSFNGCNLLKLSFYKYIFLDLSFYQSVIQILYTEFTIIVLIICENKL